MAQSDNRDDKHKCLTSVISNFHSFFSNDQTMSQLISQLESMNTRQQLSSGFPPENNSVQETGDPKENRTSLNMLEDCSLRTDLSAALGPVALMLPPVARRFSTPQLEEDNATSSLTDDQDNSREGEADPTKGGKLSLLFQSKYIHFFPLYQDYCLQAAKEDFHIQIKSSVSKLSTPKYEQRLQRLQPHQSSQCSTSPALNSPQVTPTSRRLFSKVTSCTLWQDLDEVKASGLLSSLSTKEIRLQESMFELIGSEACYLRSLGVAVSHFYASNALKETMSQMEHHILFSNIRHVMASSEMFLMDLEIRLGESVLLSEVGGVVLQHCQEFRRLYVPYVTNMMYQEALFNQLLKQNRQFLYSIKKLESDPLCQRRTLKSFLVLPFQRITRIKLILETVPKLTDPESTSILNLEKAIETIHEIVSDCNKEVKKMKQIEELVCLEMLLDFGNMKSVPLVVSGRYLVHKGPVRQLTMEATRVSFINVHLHLFNDLLIISSKKDQTLTVVDHAEFPTHVHLEHLKTGLMGLPAESFLLRLSQSQSGQRTAMILVAHTRSDKEAWMKTLTSKP